MGTEQYDPKFYDAIREGCQKSAQAVAPFALARAAEYAGDIMSVVDVGGGEGWWAQAFFDLGVKKAVCLDGGRRPASAEDVEHLTVNLLKPFEVECGYDLAVCLEVAEHLPGEAAPALVDLLTNLAPVILFSAAMPRQGGTGHINCQPPGYWADLFAEKGYGCDGSLRWDIWDHPWVEPWYQSNLLMFTLGEESSLPHQAPLHVIHPDLWLSPR